jgi:hypothetical protein
MAGELIRQAISIGYTLVSYEDTAAGDHTASQRDSIQAENIYNIIRQDSTARILVHASLPISAKNQAPMVISRWRWRLNVFRASTR